MNISLDSRNLVPDRQPARNPHKYMPKFDKEQYEKRYPLLQIRSFPTAFNKDKKGPDQIDLNQIGKGCPRISLD